ncbi:MAG: AEC family transporter [Hyphomicrobiaceae bacterium]
MIAIISIVAPIFGLILVGYLAGRFKILPDGAAAGISSFAFTLAIPALLCRTIATAELGSVSALGVWASFYIAGIANWLIAAGLNALVLKRPAADAPAVAMTATFGNTVMLGVPLSLGTFGSEAAAVVALVLAIHAPMWWLIGTLHAQAVGDHKDQSHSTIARTLLRDLVSNPIIIGILLGVAWRLTGFTMPKALDRLLELLAQAGVPTALVALGLSLLAFEIKGQGATLAAVIGLKLFVMPAMAWALAHYVFALPPVAQGVVVIMAAMPTGANAFLFASRLGRAVNSASGAVALGTLIASATAAALISVLSR